MLINRRFVFVLVLFLAVICYARSRSSQKAIVTNVQDVSDTQGSLESLSEVAGYRQELKDLYKLVSYRAYKNSFIPGLEGMSGRTFTLTADSRKTLLDVEGTGSLRHIWETHGPDTGTFELEIFIDGEPTPRIQGQLDDIIRAAHKCKQNYVMNPGSFVANRAWNLYLPIPFDKSIRVDLVSPKDVGLIFIQLDYRVEDDSMQGVQLLQKGQGKEMQLYYTGVKEPAATITSEKIQRCRYDFYGDNTIEVKGPAIIRRLGINAQRKDVKMYIRFDGETTAAVDVDMADFFGPFRGVALNNNNCYLPMPLASEAEIEIVGSNENDQWTIELEVEPVKEFKKDWGYFYAKSSKATELTDGALPYQVLYTQGRGHWLGMSMYESGHDHGGGDFTIIDGGTSHPEFLHGDFGEDYFSFAFFGTGQNFPYSEAFDNDTGRMRLHLENPYPFRESIRMSWGTLPRHKPHSVAFWYQDSPKDMTRTAEQVKGSKWLVFGPVSVPIKADGNTADTSDPAKLFAALPDPEQLDKGMEFEAEHLMFSKRFTGTFKGWGQQYAMGNHLNLTHIYGHVMDLGGDHHIGYYARAMLAKTTISSPKEQQVVFELSYDDPLQVFLNGKEVYTDMRLREGFCTRSITVQLQKGDNQLLIKMLDTPNIDACWAGISLRVLDDSGKALR